MTENDRMAELSYSYLHAVASAAGFGCSQSGRIEDNQGIDATINVAEKMAPDSRLIDFSIQIQLKATQQELTETDDHFGYFFNQTKRYDKLRKVGSMIPKLLVVLQLPVDRSLWLCVNKYMLVVKRSAYWVSLLGAPESQNKSGQTVYIPKQQILSVNGLRDIATRISREEELVYDHH